MAAALEVRDLAFGYGHAPVLQNVSFQVAEGAFATIVGPNGAGKSTLLKCVDRILEDWSGEIRLYGQDVRSISRKRLGRLVGYVPQADSRDYPFTVREFVSMGRFPHLSAFSTLTPEDVAHVERALQDVELVDLAERPLAALSGGERQRAVLGAALAQGAKLLLLDEPTTFLDYRHQMDLRALLVRINRESRITMIAVTHDLGHALWWSDQILMLHEKRLAFDGPPADCVKGDLLERVFQTRFERLPASGAGCPLPVSEPWR